MLSIYFNKIPAIMKMYLNAIYYVYNKESKTFDYLLIYTFCHSHLPAIEAEVDAPSQACEFSISLA